MYENRNKLKMDSPNTQQLNQNKFKRGNKNVTSGQQMTITSITVTNNNKKNNLSQGILQNTTVPWSPPIAVASTSNVINIKTNHTIPSDILDDLSSRFIINVPDDERSNLIRICFQVELAHWFYLDFFCSIVERKLVPCGFKQFASHIFHHLPFLQKHLLTLDKTLDDWKTYKLSVPTYGAILLTKDLQHALLVQSYLGKCWGFPKGKINENEDPVHCAIREVYEETGYDLTGLIVPNEYIDCVINYQFVRLYIVRNVPYDTKFSPRTRNEIKCCEWFPVDSLPTNRNDAISKQNLGINANLFFMIMPFIKRLKKWIHDNRTGVITKRELPSPVMTYNNYTGGGQYNRQSSKSEGDTTTNPKFHKRNTATNQSFGSKDVKTHRTPSKTDRTTTATALIAAIAPTVSKAPSTPTTSTAPQTSISKPIKTTTTTPKSTITKTTVTSTTKTAPNAIATTSSSFASQSTTTVAQIKPKPSANVTSDVAKSKVNLDKNKNNQFATRAPFQFKRVKKFTPNFDAWSNFKFDVDEIVKVF